MAYVYLDKTDDGRFAVRVLSGLRGDKTTTFDKRDDALGFATSKMGRTGTMIDTTLMTPEQLEAHRAKKSRQREALGLT